MTTALVPLASTSLVAAQDLSGLDGTLANITGLGNGATLAYSISRDGRYVVFGSTASNLTPGDINGKNDIFLLDTATGVIDNITEDFDDHSYEPHISADGSTIAFVSLATNQSDGTNDGFFNLFIHNVESGSAYSIYATGKDVSDVSLSGTGRYLAASVEGQIWRLDLDDLSASDQITLGRNEFGVHPQISEWGDHVVFASTSPDFGGAPGDGISGIFLWSKRGETGGEEIASLTPGAVESSFLPSVNADGTRVAFTSRAWNLVDNDLNQRDDLFLWDAVTGLANLTVQGNNHSNGGTISADGQRIAFSTTATNLATNVTSQASSQTVVVWDEPSNTFTSLTASGNSDASTPVITADGNSVLFQSSATNLVADDLNGHTDGFLWRDSNPIPSVNPYDWTELEPVPGSTMEAATTFEEFVNAVDFDPIVHGEILRLYPAFFNRQPDLGGARYWILEVHAQGQTIDQITAYFSDPLQTEFVKFYEDIPGDDHEAYLARVYQNMLGRPADPDGFAYWLNLMETDQLDRGSVVRWVALNEEFILRNNYGR